MNKVKGLVSAVAKDCGLTQEQVKSVFVSYSKVIEGMKVDDVVTLPYLGKFSVSMANPRIAFNPQNGEQIDIPAQPKISFKITQAVKQKIKAQ